MSRRTAHALAALVLALGLVGGTVAVAGSSASANSSTSTGVSLGLCCSGH